MLEFLNGLAPLEKGFWYVALISSAIFAIQSIMTFVGGHDADGINADFSGDLDHVDAPFQFFSFRNLINFMLGFGWTGAVFYNTIETGFTNSACNAHRLSFCISFLSDDSADYEAFGR
jgi:hypothetical protein